MVPKQRLTAKRVRELLAYKKVHNDFGLVGDTEGKQPVITYRSGWKKRNVESAWQVITPGRSTNPDGHYRDDFNQTFVVTRADAISREQVLSEALVWAEERYNVAPWAKTPFGGWMSKAHLDARLRELLPEHFDPEYRDPTAKKIVDKLYGDGSGERMFRVVVQLYAKPEPPLYVNAADADAAYRQVTQLFTRLAGTRVLDGLKLNVYDA